MKTFLLYWNPFFSSYKTDDFFNDFKFAEGKDVLREESDWDRLPEFFNWSIAEHEKAQECDRFIFIKVGYVKPTGIIGVGTFMSDPYQGEDWSGQGRKIYYMDMAWETVVNPTSDKVLKTNVLIDAIPEVHWAGGKAGTEVAPEIAARIEALWKEHLKSVK